MTPAQPPLCLRVEAPGVAALLLDPRTLVGLTPFIGRMRSAADVAAESGRSLLRVAAVTPRKGRAVKRYQAVADAFFVPYAATPNEVPETLLAAEHRRFQAQFTRNFVRVGRDEIGAAAPQVWGVRVHLNGDGRLIAYSDLEEHSAWCFTRPQAPAMTDLWANDVRLDFNDAKALQQEMAALLERYRRRGGQQGYIVRLAMAPIVEAD